MHLIRVAAFPICVNALEYASQTKVDYDTLREYDHALPQYMRGYFAHELGPNYMTVRITILVIILSCIFAIGALVFYSVNKYVSSPRRNRQKISLYLQDSNAWGLQGRAKKCIRENGCSGGTVDSCRPKGVDRST